MERGARHFQDELEVLNSRLLEMGGLAEERVRRSVELRQPPFDDATPQRWLAALRAVMM